MSASDASHESSKPTIYNRPPRIQPALPSGDFTIASPPAINNRPQRVNVLTVILPVVLLLVSSLTFLQPGRSNQTLVFVGLGAMILVTLVGSVGNIVWERRNRRQDDAEQIAAYRRLLQQQRDKLQRLREEQQRLRSDNDPAPQTVLNWPQKRDLRLWERRPNDRDFLSLRLGIGELPSSVKIIPPKTDHPGPLFQEAQQVADEYRIVRDVPVIVDLQEVGSLGIAGPSEGSTGLLRAALVHLIAHHSPDELRIAAIVAEEAVSEWNWLRQLPHTQPLNQDSSVEMVATTTANIEQLMTNLLDELSRRDRRQQTNVENDSDQPVPPHVVLILIGRNQIIEHITVGYILRRGNLIGASAICLVNKRRYIPGEVGAVVEIVGLEQANYATTGPNGVTRSCIPDTASLEQCRALARDIAPLRMRGINGTADLPRNVRLLALLTYNLQHYNPGLAWQQPKFGYLRSPIGVQVGGQPLVFDLVEHGPHGLIAGTTGAGKSELLQTLIVGLALTHDPRTLNFVLVDYKGGGSLGMFKHLPHNVGLITNLSGRLAERAIASFDAELKRRQRLFAEVGAPNLAEYRRRRPHSILPNLLIVVDEFAELKRELPDFMGRLISIAQTGRTLGIHLLLATQRPTGVVDANIWANTNFRICLRVVSLEDSREVLGRPDAALLPHNRPGRGYFQVGHEIFQQFQTARVAASHSDPVPASLSMEMSSSDPADDGSQNPLIAPDASDAEVAVALLAQYAHSEGLDHLQGPWSEPLPSHTSLDMVWQQIVDVHDNIQIQQSDQGAGEVLTKEQMRAEFHRTAATVLEQLRHPDATSTWHWDTLQQGSWLQAPIGLWDDLNTQQHRPLILDLQQEGTHLLVAGSAASGKSTLLRTVITSLAVAHDPASLWFYLIDFGGQALAPLVQLPHLGGFFRQTETDRIRRLLRRLRSELDRRKGLLGEVGATNLWQYRSRSQTTPLAALMVVIDNFSGFREQFEDDLPVLAAIARDGKAVGIHLLLTIDRPSAIPLSLASNIELQLSLRLTDPSESLTLLNKPDAALLESDKPGRGFRKTHQLIEFQIALPTVATSEDTQGTALIALVKRMQQGWNGIHPEPIELLPDHVGLQELIDAPATRVLRAMNAKLPVPIAIDDQQLCPLAIDLERDGPHMLIAGSAGSGKSVLLRTWILALALYTSPQSLQFVLINFRRSLKTLRQLHHITDSGYIDSPLRLSAFIPRLQEEFERRKAKLQEWLANEENDESFDVRSLGPLLVIAIDDCEQLLASASSMDISILVDIAKGSRDLGFHLIVAGSAEDLNRSYESLVTQLKAGRAGALLRVNDPSDGAVLNVRLPYNIQPSDYPPGRGYLVTPTGSRLVQFATSNGAEHDADAVLAWVAQINQRPRSVHPSLLSSNNGKTL